MRKSLLVLMVLFVSSLVPAQSLSDSSDAPAFVESASTPSKTTPAVSVGSSGLILSTADGADTLRVHGYVQADDRMFSSNTHGEGLDSFLFRRIRPLFEGTLFNAVDFRFMPDFGQKILKSRKLFWS